MGKSKDFLIMYYLWIKLLIIVKCNVIWEGREIINFVFMLFKFIFM